jgi:subfamily B ATP-binding cassette protein MsbA
MSQAKAATPVRLSQYRRLLTLARPYRVRLVIGIVAGLFCAGTFFGLLSFLPNAFAAFKHIEEPAPVVTNAAAVTENPPTAVPVDNMPGAFRSAEHLAARFNIPLRNADNTLTWQALFLGLLGLPIVALLRIVSSFINQYYMRWVGACVVRDLRDQLFDSLQKQSLKFFGQCDIGHLISRCVNDAASVEHVVSVTIADAVRAPFEILAAVLVAVLYAIHNDLGGMLLIAGVLLPLCLVPVIVLGTHVKRWTRRSLERVSDLVSRMHENFTGIRVIKAFHTEALESRRFREMNLHYFASVLRALRAELLMSPLMELVITFLACGFVIACFIYKIKLEQITVIGVSVFAAYRPMKQLAKISASMQRGSAALDRIFALLDTDTALPEAVNPVKKTSFDDRIVFDHVNFRFSPDGPDVINDVAFELRRGSLLALVGETGSGKTTLANLLARFYDPVAGAVTLDGVDLRAIATQDLRRMMGVVTQDTILFNDTIANNIAYGTPDATQKQIEEAAGMANAHEFIVAHPDGYGRIVGDKGFVLSGGEKQRVALARAILRNPPILILDEATSALDTVTERLVQEAIAKVMQNRTTLAIAHRLSTVRRADMILVVDAGRIIEQGTHDQLFAQGGRYRKLCDMQLSE